VGGGQGGRASCAGARGRGKCSQVQNGKREQVQAGVQPTAASVRAQHSTTPPPANQPITPAPPATLLNTMLPVSLVLTTPPQQPPKAVFWRSLRNHVPRFRPAPFALGSPSLPTLRSPLPLASSPPALDSSPPCRPVLGPLPALLPLPSIPFCAPFDAPSCPRFLTSSFPVHLPAALHALYARLCLRLCLRLRLRLPVRLPELPPAAASQLQRPLPAVFCLECLSSMAKNGLARPA
jgi:hypothetical protein